jgi:hypothetical protein
MALGTNYLIFLVFEKGSGTIRRGMRALASALGLLHLPRAPTSLQGLLSYLLTRRAIAKGVLPRTASPR